MLRLLLWVAIAYLLYWFVRRLIVEIKRYFPGSPHVRSSTSTQPSENHIDYTNVQDADFEDLKEGKDDPSST